MAKFAEFTSVLKNSPDARFRPRSATKRPDFRAFQARLLVIIRPTPTFSTGWGVLRSSDVGRAFLCKDPSEQAPLTTLLAQRLLDSCYRGRRVLHLYDQSGVAFVLEPDHHRLLGVMHVPEHALTLLVEGARCDDPRHVRSTDPGASPPPLRFLRIRLGTHYVREWDLQATLESPQLVHASHMDNQGVFGKLHFGHSG